MLPQNLQIQIDKSAEEYSQKLLKQNAKQISDNYRFLGGNDKVLLSTQNQAMAYAISRMPATYGACFSAVQQTIKNLDVLPSTVLDVGAGTGTASWAVSELLNIKHITCLEREPAMINLGSRFMKNGSSILQNAVWKNFDLQKQEISGSYDYVIASYVLNEFSPEQRQRAVDKLWQATNNLLTIIEPGTPQGYEQIMAIKQQLVNLGAYVVAPCTQTNCPLKQGEWCNFSTRVARTKLHKQTKSAQSPFEDERFIYISVSKNKVDLPSSRVIKKPYFRPKVVTLQVCTNSGINNLQISKSHPQYKFARDLKHGDNFNFLDKNS